MNANEEVAQGYVAHQTFVNFRAALEQERGKALEFHSAEISAVCDVIKLFPPEVVASLLLRWASS